MPRVRFGGNLAMEVAAAAEAQQPRDALRLYRETIARLIAARGRGNYAQAAEYLLRVRDLYDRLGEPDQWATYIAATRNQKPRLPALLDELRQVGL